MSGVLDRDIRVRLLYLTENQDIVKADLKELTGLVGQLTTSINGLIAKESERGQKSREENNRTLGILEQLQARYRQLSTAIEQATSVEDIRKLNAELDKTQKEITAATNAGRQMDTAFKGVGSTVASVGGLIASAFTAYEVINFSKQIIEARSNMQGFEIALKTMLGSKQEADSLMTDLVKFAQKTPFELKELQQLTSQLLAFGFTSKEVIPTLTMLGNIAAGVGTDKLPLMVTALGQVRTATVLTGQDLLQFYGNGVPLLEELTKVTGISAAKIQSDTKSLGITYQQVALALQNLTTEGGRFNNLMANGSEILKVSVSNLSDAYYQVKAKLGEYIQDGLQPALAWGTRFLNNLAENRAALEKFIDYVKAGVTVWAAYRAAMLAVQLQQAANIAAAKAAGLTLAEYQAQLTVTTSVTNLANSATTGLKVGLTGLWTAIRTNPIGILIGVIGLATSAWLSMRDAQSEVGEGMDSNTKKIFEEKNRLETLVGAIVHTNSSYEIRKGLIQKLRQEYPEFLRGISDENVSNRTLLNLLGRVNIGYQERILLARQAYNVERNTTELKKLWDEQADALENLRKKFPNLKIESQDLGEAMAEVARKTATSTKETTVMYGVAITRTTDSLNEFKGVYEKTSKRIGELNQANMAAETAAEKMRAQFAEDARQRHAVDVAREKELEQWRKGRLGQEKAYTVEMEQEYQKLVRDNKAYEDALKKSGDEIVKNHEKRKAAAKSSYEVELETRLASLKNTERTLDEELNYIRWSADKEIEVINRKAADKELTEKQASERRIAIDRNRLRAMAETEKEYRDKEDKEREKWLNSVEKDVDDVRKALAKKRREDLEKQADEQRAFDKLNQAMIDARTQYEMNAAVRRELIEAGSDEKRSEIIRKFNERVAEEELQRVQGQIDRERMYQDFLKAIGREGTEAFGQSKQRELKLLADYYKIADDLSKEDLQKAIALAQRREQINREMLANLKGALLDFLNASDNALVKSLATGVNAWFDYAEKAKQINKDLNAGVIDGQKSVEMQIAFITMALAQTVTSIWKAQGDERQAQLQRELDAFKAAKEQELATLKTNNEQKVQSEKDAASRIEQMLVYDNNLRNSLLDQAKARELAALYEKRSNELSVIDELLVKYKDDKAEKDRLTAERAAVVAKYQEEEATITAKYEDVKLNKAKGVDLATAESQKQSSDRQLQIAKELAEGENRIKDAVAAKEREIRAMLIEQDYRAKKAQLAMSMVQMVATTFGQFGIVGGAVAAAGAFVIFDQLNTQLQQARDGQLAALGIGGGMTADEILRDIDMQRKINQGGNLFDDPKVVVDPKDIVVDVPNVPKPGSGAATASQPYGTTNAQEIEAIKKWLGMDLAAGPGQKGPDGHEMPVGVSNWNGTYGTLVFEYGTDGNASRFAPAFHEGSEFVKRGDRGAKNGFRIYSQPEFPALLLEGERVLNPDQNKRLGGISNEQLVRMVEAYRGGSSVHYKPIDLSGFGPVGQATDMGPMLQKMDALRDALEKQPQFHANFDERGMSISQRKGLAKTNYRNNRFRK